MTTCDDYINKVTQNLPESCKTKDLVNAGIFKHYAGAAMLRKQQKGPPYLKIEGKGIIYPKECVIEWLKNCKHAN